MYEPAGGVSLGLLYVCSTFARCLLDHVNGAGLLRLLGLVLVIYSHNTVQSMMKRIIISLHGRSNIDRITNLARPSVRLSYMAS